MKIKSALTAIKNDIKDHPASYALAVTLGVSAGIFIYKTASKEAGFIDGVPDLQLPQSIMQELKDTPSYFRYSSPEGDFALTYIQPE